MDYTSVWAMADFVSPETAGVCAEGFAPRLCSARPVTPFAPVRGEVRHFSATCEWLLVVLCHKPGRGGYQGGVDAVVPFSILTGESRPVDGH